MRFLVRENGRQPSVLFIFLRKVLLILTQGRRGALKVPRFIKVTERNMFKMYALFPSSVNKQILRETQRCSL